MKFAVLMTLVLIGLNSNATSIKRNLTCVDESVQDSALALEITDVFTEKSLVNLTVPTGESSVQVLKGELKRGIGVIQTYKANFFTSTDSGYEVLVVPAAGDKLQAIVQPWAMSGRQKPTIIPCH